NCSENSPANGVMFLQFNLLKVSFAISTRAGLPSMVTTLAVDANVIYNVLMPVLVPISNIVFGENLLISLKSIFPYFDGTEALAVISDNFNLSPELICEPAPKSNAGIVFLLFNCLFLISSIKSKASD